MPITAVSRTRTWAFATWFVTRSWRSRSWGNFNRGRAWPGRAHLGTTTGSRLCPKDQPQQVRMPRVAELSENAWPRRAAAAGAPHTAAVRSRAFGGGFKKMRPEPKKNRLQKESAGLMLIHENVNPNFNPRSWFRHRCSHPNAGNGSLVECRHGTWGRRRRAQKGDEKRSQEGTGEIRIWRENSHHRFPDSAKGQTQPDSSHYVAGDNH